MADVLAVSDESFEREVLQSATPGAGRLLGALVRPLSRDRTDRRRAVARVRRQAQGRQDERRRQPAHAVAVRRPRHPHPARDPGRPGEGAARRRAAQGASSSARSGTSSRWRSRSAAASRAGAWGRRRRSGVLALGAPRTRHVPRDLRRARQGLRSRAATPHAPAEPPGVSTPSAGTPTAAARARAPTRATRSPLNPGSGRGRDRQR